MSGASIDPSLRPTERLLFVLPFAYREFAMSPNDTPFHRLDLHDRTTEEWRMQALRFDKMADRLKAKPALSARFRQLASDARKRAKDQDEAAHPRGAVKDPAS